MTKAVRVLIAVVLAGVGLAVALVLSGCDDNAVAETTPALGATSVDPAPARPATAAEEQIAVAGRGEETDLRVSVDELIRNPANYAGQEVIVQGMIVTQCIRGCQFSLDDGTGVVGVELVEEALENVLTTGSIGRIAEVRGTVEGSPRPVILVKDHDGWRYVD